MPSSLCISNQFCGHLNRNRLPNGYNICAALTITLIGSNLPLWKSSHSLIAIRLTVRASGQFSPLARPPDVNKWLWEPGNYYFVAAAAASEVSGRTKSCFDMMRANLSQSSQQLKRRRGRGQEVLEENEEMRKDKRFKRKTNARF